MTEYNYFCWSKKFNDENSFQQKRYRIFNVEVSEKEYRQAKKIYHELKFDEEESLETRFQTAFKEMWNNLTEEEKQEYFEIPHFNWEGFTFITGIERIIKATEEEDPFKELRKTLEDCQRKLNSLSPSVYL